MREGTTMALQISTSRSHQLLKRVFTSLAVFALLFQPLAMGGFAQALATTPTVKVNLNRSSLVSSGAFVNQNKNPEIQARDDIGLDRIEMQKDGSSTLRTWNAYGNETRRANISFLGDGKYTITAFDTEENASEPFVIHLDRTNPTTTLEVPDGLAPNEFTVSGIAEDNISLNRVYVQLVNRDNNQRYGGTTIHMIGDGTESHWSKTYDATALNLPEGDYAVHASVVDRAGNNGSTGWSEDFTLDKTLPEISVKSDFKGDISQRIFRIVSFKLHDTQKVDKYELNGTTRDVTDSNWSDANYQNIKNLLEEGANSITLYDVAGNTTVYEFTYDTTAPNANAGLDQEITGSKSATLSGSSDDASASFEWELVSGPGAVTFADNQTATTAVSVDTYGTYIFKLTTKDTAGNPASDDVTVTFVQQTEEPEDNTGGDTDTEGSTNNQSDDNSQESTTEDDEQLFTTSQSFGLNSELLASTNQEGDDENEQAILSTSNQNTDENGNVLAATDEQDGCYKLFGLCWYWWIPIGVGVIGILWFLFASRSKHNDDDLPPRRQG